MASPTMVPPRPAVEGGLLRQGVGRSVLYISKNERSGFANHIPLRLDQSEPLDGKRVVLIGSGRRSYANHGSLIQRLRAYRFRQADLPC